MNTKDRILTTALELFNQQGTAPVSTNHIAEAAMISPGNLYYHYRNKEEIIRAICERLFATWDAAFELDHTPTVADLEVLVRTNFRIAWDYRFVYREILALMRQDAALHERYIAVRQRGYSGFRELIGVLSAAGVLLSDLDAGTVTRLADLCWLISESWLTSLELQGAVADDDHMQRGVDLMLFVLKPYRRG